VERFKSITITVIFHRNNDVKYLPLRVIYSFEELSFSENKTEAILSQFLEYTLRDVFTVTPFY